MRRVRDARAQASSEPERAKLCGRRLAQASPMKPTPTATNTARGEAPDFRQAAATRGTHRPRYRVEDAEGRPPAEQPGRSIHRLPEPRERRERFAAVRGREGLRRHRPAVRQDQFAKPELPEDVDVVNGPEEEQEEHPGCKSGDEKARGERRRCIGVNRHRGPRRCP